MLPVKAPNVLILAIVAVSIFHSSCSSNKANEQALILINETLKKQAQSNRKDTELQLLRIEEKQYDFKYDIKVWYPKAVRIHDIGSHGYRKLDSLLKLFNANNERSTYQTAEEIYTDHRNLILGVDTEIYKTFGNHFADSAHTKNVDPSMLQTMLHKKLLDISALENAAVYFCDSKTGTTADFFPTFKAIVGQSSNVLRPGQILTLTAGIGQFSRVARPTITINNRVVEVDASATATEDIKVPQKPGKYSIPLHISYINSRGITESKTYRVEYEVVN